MFGSLGLYSGVGSQAQIVFNGYSIHDPAEGLVVQRLRADNMPSRSLRLEDVPRNNGRYITGDYFRTKSIPLKGVIKKATSELLEEELFLMKKALSKRERILDITVNDVIYRWIATLTNGDRMFDRREGYHVTVVPFDLEFDSVEPFGKSIEYESVAWIDETRLDFDEELTHDGNAEAKLVLILNFTAAVSITQISFTNNTREESIVLTQAISAGDYVRFDSEEQEVTVNGAPVDFFGTFPVLDPGVNSFTLALTGTSAEFTMTAKHKKTYY